MYNTGLIRTVGENHTSSPKDLRNVSRRGCSLGYLARQLITYNIDIPKNGDIITSITERSIWVYVVQKNIQLQENGTSG